MYILLTVAISFYKTLVNIVQHDGCKWETVDDLIELISNASQKAARHAVEAIVKVLNSELHKNPKLTADGWRLKERTLKTLHTSLGDLILERVVYQNRVTHKCAALLFETLGITPHQRMSRELMYQVLELSAGMSFQKAIDALGADIHRQIAINWLREKIPVLEKVADEVREAKVLHVFLDEDHLSMMKDPTRKHMVLPVGTVAEGRWKECEGRYRLLNPFYCLSNDLTSASLVETIVGYIAMQYDVSVLEKIYIHGDGAKWIGKTLEEYFSAEYVYDGFHLERDIRRACRRFGDDNKQVQKMLRQAIADNNRDLAEAILATFAANTGDTVILQKMEKFCQHLLEYWDGIRSRLPEACPMGSCTEAQVQHIASERFTSTPHGWSRATIAKLASLRAFILNGGSLTKGRHLGQPVGTYAGYMDQCIEELKSQTYDFSIFDQISCPSDGNSGTQHLLRILDHGGQLAPGQ